MRCVRKFPALPRPRQINLLRDPKDKLVAGLKASFDFCTTALANVDDSKLSEPMVLFGRVPSSRAGALIALSMGFADHYGAPSHLPALKRNPSAHRATEEVNLW